MKKIIEMLTEHRTPKGFVYLGLTKGENGKDMTIKVFSREPFSLRKPVELDVEPGSDVVYFIRKG